MTRPANLVLTALLVGGSAAAHPLGPSPPNPERPAERQRSAVATSVIDGSVRDTSGALLPDVQVSALDDPRIRTRTGPAGTFRIDSVPPGAHVVRFRRLGIMPLSVPVQVIPNQTTTIDVVVEPIPTVLSGIVIQEQSGEIVTLPPGVADRVRHGQGTYITAADIERQRPMRTRELFMAMPGVEVTKDGGINNSRGIISLLTPGCRYGMPVYINGSKLADPHHGDDTLHGRPLVDYVQPRDIAVIEVYRGPATMPATVSQDKCGGVFIWTKH
jgi:hypothetical protein